MRKRAKLERPHPWPPPPEEEFIPKAKNYKEGGKLGYTLPEVKNTTPMPPVMPPKAEKDWSYEVLSEPAHHITSKLNFYKERKRLRNIVSMTATDNTTTILLEVYDW